MSLIDRLDLFLDFKRCCCGQFMDLESMVLASPEDQYLYFYTVPGKTYNPCYRKRLISRGKIEKLITIREPNKSLDSILVVVSCFEEQELPKMLVYVVRYNTNDSSFHCALLGSYHTSERLLDCLSEPLFPVYNGANIAYIDYLEKQLVVIDLEGAVLATKTLDFGFNNVVFKPYWIKQSVIALSKSVSLPQKKGPSLKTLSSIRFFKILATSNKLQEVSKYVHEIKEHGAAKILVAGPARLSEAETKAVVVVNHKMCTCVWILDFSKQNCTIDYSIRTFKASQWFVGPVSSEDAIYVSNIGAAIQCTSSNFITILCEPDRSLVNILPLNAQTFYQETVSRDDLYEISFYNGNFEWTKKFFGSPSKSCLELKCSVSTHSGDNYVFQTGNCVQVVTVGIEICPEYLLSEIQNTCPYTAMWWLDDKFMLVTGPEDTMVLNVQEGEISQVNLWYSASEKTLAANHKSQVTPSGIKFKSTYQIENPFDSPISSASINTFNQIIIASGPKAVLYQGVNVEYVLTAPSDVLDTTICERYFAITTKYKVYIYDLEQKTLHQPSGYGLPKGVCSFQATNQVYIVYVDGDVIRWPDMSKMPFDEPIINTYQVSTSEFILQTASNRKIVISPTRVEYLNNNEPNTAVLAPNFIYNRIIVLKNEYIAFYTLALPYKRKTVTEYQAPTTPIYTPKTVFWYVPHNSQYQFTLINIGDSHSVHKWNLPQLDCSHDFILLSSKYLVELRTSQDKLDEFFNKDEDSKMDSYFDVHLFLYLIEYTSHSVHITLKDEKVYNDLLDINNCLAIQRVSDNELLLKLGAIGFDMISISESEDKFQTVVHNSFDDNFEAFSAKHIELIANSESLVVKSPHGLQIKPQICLAKTDILLPCEYAPQKICEPLTIIYQNGKYFCLKFVASTHKCELLAVAPSVIPTSLAEFSTLGYPQILATSAPVNHKAKFTVYSPQTGILLQVTPLANHQDLQDLQLRIHTQCLIHKPHTTEMAKNIIDLNNLLNGWSSNSVVFTSDDRHNVNTLIGR